MNSKENFFSPQLINLLEKFCDLFQKHIESQIQTKHLRSEINKRKEIEITLEKKVTQRIKESLTHSEERKSSY